MNEVIDSSKRPELNTVTVGICTFLRDQKLIAATIPLLTWESPILVVDCGHPDKFKEQLLRTNQMYRERDQYICLPFDSGFGKMRNTLADNCKTEYLLIGSDDFDFAPAKVKSGVADAVNFLNTNPSFSVVGGRVSNREYEMDLLIEEDASGIAVTEIPAKLPHYFPGMKVFPQVDLTANYCLCRTGIFKSARWLDDVKIGGGEHAAFFIQLKKRGYKVAFYPNMVIGESVQEDPTDYKPYRMRAKNKARPYYDWLGVTKYTTKDGFSDYEKA